MVAVHRSSRARGSDERTQDQPLLSRDLLPLRQFVVADGDESALKARQPVLKNEVTFTIWAMDGVEIGLVETTESPDGKRPMRSRHVPWDWSVDR
jgi:hypothetical protein